MDIGDKFKFDIKLMRQNGISLPQKHDRYKVHTILDIIYEESLGYIITFKKSGAQVNSCWIKED